MELKAKKIIGGMILTVLILLLAASGSLFFYQKAYAGKIYKNVSANNIDLSGLTKIQASAIIDKNFQNYADQQITIRTENKEITTYIKDTGLTLDSTTIANNCYSTGRDVSFVRHLFKSGKTYFIKSSLKIDPKIDDSKYEEFKKIAINQLNFEPKDATLAIENGQIKEVEGSNGQMVEADDLPSQIISLANNTNKTIVLSSNTVKPNITSANFSEAKTQTENILQKNLTFSYEDKSFTPSRRELGLWLGFKNDIGKFSVTLNENNIKAYINKISKNFEIEKRDKKVNANDGNIIDPGQEGKYVDKNVALSQIKSQVYAAAAAPIKIALATYTQAPDEVKVFPSEGLVPGRFEGKYIDVDLTHQKLCKVESTAVLECFTISSGKPSMPTPTGTFHITSKNPKQWSRKYSLWMPYWEQFNGDYGLHELPEWPNGYKEGEAHLGTPVSHGCVRLGTGPAENVYNWTVIGTPVFIHK